MDIKFSFDKSGFERLLRNQVKTGVARFGDRVQALFDEVYAARGGEPTVVVAGLLRERAASADLNFTPEQIEFYAKAISEGRHIRVEVDASSL